MTSPKIQLITRFAPKVKDSEKSGASKPPPVEMPKIITAAELIHFHDNSAPPVELVRGILHRGEKFMLAGPSKGRKSWALLDLAVSVATGKPFWELETTQGRVLIVNFEIQKYFMGARLKRVMRAKGVDSLPDELDVWNLRGHRAGFAQIISGIRELIETKNYALVIFDPLYAGLQGRDENSAGDIADLMASLETLAAQGAAVAMAHHFAKGNSAMKESLDRASGSGVFARDPDCVVTLNNHEQENRFVAEITLRNFAPKDKIGLCLDFPLLVPDETLDLEQIKGAKMRAAKVSVQDMLELLPLDADMETCELRDKAKHELGIKDRKFYDLLKDARASGMIEKTADGMNRRVIGKAKKK